MDRFYRTVNIKDQEIQHYYSHLIQHDARQRCPALIVLKEEHNNVINDDINDVPYNADHRSQLLLITDRKSLTGFRLVGLPTSMTLNDVNGDTDIEAHQSLRLSTSLT